MTTTATPTNHEERLLRALCVSVLVFAGWTVAVHLAVLTGVPWVTLTRGFLVSLPAVLLLSWRLAVATARSFSEETREVRDGFSLGPRPLSLTAGVAWIASIALARSYEIRYLLTCLFLLSAWYLKARLEPGAPESDSCLAGSGGKTTRTAAKGELERHGSRGVKDGHACLYVLGLTLLAIAVTLTAHRPDLDDSSFLQIAASTLDHPSLPIYSFDSSLGVQLDRFRFAPYVLSSYEPLAALLTHVTGLGLFSVYYVALPAVSAALTIVTAYFLARWFLPSGAALVAIALFFLICLAWGESHLAYGNRLFVRLFQGKGLLIGLTTPSILLSGLLAMRRPRWHTRLFFLGCIVAGIGVSSTGLIVTIVAASIAIAAGTDGLARETIRRAALTAPALAYPIAAGLLLKYLAKTSVPFSELGTVTGIDASLGCDAREAISLITIGIGAASLRLHRQHRTLFLCLLLTVVITLSPFVSRALAAVSVGNATWRLAWAAPVPLFMAIILAGLSARSSSRREVLPGLLAAAVLLSFALSGRWSLAGSNGVSFGKPSPTISAGFHTTADITGRIKVLAPRPVLLATRDIAAWVPLASPGMQLVMPGHTFPSMLRTILSPDDYAERMRLFSIVNGARDLSPEAVSQAARLFRKYGVNVVVARRDSPDDLAWVGAMSSMGLVPRSRFELERYVAYFY
jgi:hypothetical protein